MSSILVVDNGAYDIKAGFSQEKDPRLFPNAVVKARNERKRIYVANQVHECKDMSGLFYLLPFQKGFLITWDVEKQIWSHIFGKDNLRVDFADTSLVFTEPCFNFASLQECLDEVIFEDYKFASLLRVNAPSLSALHYWLLNPRQRCCLVVDSGYSFTHIVPFCNGKQLTDKILRIDVGGKALTNHLKEIISYRQLNVMDETYVVNQCKEDCCYVAADFIAEMKAAKQTGVDNKVQCDYVLPDFSTITRGYQRETHMTSSSKNDEQIVRLNNERFSVPEILFRPSDIGMNQMGIPEAIVHIVQSLPSDLQPLFYNNILLTGGNCLFPGFRERVQAEVRSLACVDYDVRVILPNNPITFAWEGGQKIAEKPFFPELTVSRKEYQEFGHEYCQKKFGLKRTTAT